jgi:hypothetical protein
MISRAGAVASGSSYLFSQLLSDRLAFRGARSLGARGAVGVAKRIAFRDGPTLVSLLERSLRYADSSPVERDGDKEGDP